MRYSYIITYDICDAKRLRQVFKIMRKWGDHLQYSVFECQLTRTELIQLRSELLATILSSEDQVLFINLGPSHGRSDRVIEAIGLPYAEIVEPCLVV